MFSYQKTEHGVFERIGARQNKVRLEKKNLLQYLEGKGRFQTMKLKIEKKC